MWTVPDTIPDDFLVMPGVDEEDLTSEDRRLPCSLAGPHVGHLWNQCESKGEKPATWIVSHENAEAQCAVPVCEDCCAHLQQWIATCVCTNGPHGFKCPMCRYGPFHYREFITREL